MKMSKYLSLFLFSSLLFLVSCEKQDNYSKLLVNYRYEASFSLPIGDTSLNIENNGRNLPPDWQIDTILQNLDSIELQQKMTFIFLNSVKEVSYVRRLFLRVLVTNEFPAEAHIMFYFADSLNNILDSLSGVKLISPAIVDSTGKVIHTGYTVQDIEVINNHYNKWGNVQSVYVSGYIIKTSSNLYKYYKNYRLKIEMGFRVDFDHTFHKKVF
jgi:hypothetical protein